MKLLEAMKRLTGKPSDEDAKFVDAEMARQKARLRVSRRNVNRVGIDMSRSRNEILEKEKQLMAQVRKCVERGDMATARILASQVLHFRSLASETLIASAKLMGRSAVMETRSRLTSNSLQAMRGIVWAEGGGIYKQKEATELSVLADACDAVEDLAAEAFEDIYEPTTPDSAVSSRGRILVESIIDEATVAPSVPTPVRPTKEQEEVLLVVKLWTNAMSTATSPLTAEPMEDGLLAAFPKVPHTEPTTAATVLRVPRAITGDDLKRWEKRTSICGFCADLTDRYFQLYPGEPHCLPEAWTCSSRSAWWAIFQDWQR